MQPLRRPQVPVVRRVGPHPRARLQQVRRERLAGGAQVNPMTKERLHVLQDMTGREHVDEAYRLMAESYADTQAGREREAVNASLAVAHLLLADRKGN